jgi:hypothetical protein
MSNVTRLPPFAKTIHVEAEIPISQRDEFDRAMVALEVIEKATNENPTTGGAGRLVRLLAGLYNGQDYPFAMMELRGLDTVLANACLDYLNYDRLGIKEVHRHLANDDRDLPRWIEEYRVEAASRS